MSRLCLCLLLLAIGAHAQRVIQFGDSPPRFDGLEILADADASNGLAYYSPKGRDGSIQFGYSWETMGLFEATFYLKTDDAATTEPVVHISYTCETTRFPSPPPEVLTRRVLTGTDFEAPDTWQAFTLRWVSPHVARNGYQIVAKGAAGVAADRIETRRLRDVTEAELLQYLDIAEPPAPEAPPVGPRRIHLTLGAFADYWLVDWALARLRGAEVVTSSWSSRGHAAEQPVTPANLYRYDAVILAGADIRHLPLAMRPAYAKWVRAGGCLVFLGGPYSFGQSGLADSSLRELLPVKLNGSFDLQRETHPFTSDQPAVADILADGDTTPVTFFRHQLAAKPGATIWLGTADAPLLVSGKVGQGTVIAGCFAPMGEATDAAAGQVAFWDDPRWSQVLAEVLRQTMRRDPTPLAQWTPPAQPSAAAKAVIDAASGGMDALEADLLDDLGGGDAGGGGDAPPITPEQAQLLIREGGRPAVPLLLQAMATMTDHALIRQAEYAVRPHLTPADAANVQALVDSPHQMVRESGIALLGRTHPQPPDDFAGRLGIQDTRLLRAAIRSVREGGYSQYLDRVKALHAKLKAEVEEKRLSKYEGYWYGGFQVQDPIWPYTEATLTLVAAGQADYLADLTDLWLLLHLHHLRMRSFIYLYNDKVPRELEAMERHRERNVFLHPELHDTLAQVRRVASSLPQQLHQPFQQQVLATQDLELLRLLLYPAYDLAGESEALDTHVIQAAQGSDRL